MIRFRESVAKNIVYPIKNITKIMLGEILIPMQPNINTTIGIHATKSPSTRFVILSFF